MKQAIGKELVIDGYDKILELPLGHETELFLGGLSFGSGGRRLHHAQ
ncbi:MAG: hypothetical protein V3S41_09885 [Spirochaetia bacterium]